MKRITFLAAIISGFMLFGAQSAIAVNEICNSVVGAPGTGVCTVSTAHPPTLPVPSGAFTVDRNLHITGAGKLITGAGGIDLMITNGDFVMESGALIDGNVSGCNTGGKITVTVDNGNVDLKTGSIIRSNSCSGGAIEITTTGSHTANLAGTIESVGSITGTGGSQRPGGGTITVVAGCGLTVGDTGIVSSRGKDPGADLVHLQGCTVTINGLVESTGAGHALPSNPANHCNGPGHIPGGSPSTFFTACVEIWSGTRVIIDDKNHNGQVNADTGQSGGTSGRGWIDIYARSDIVIRGMVDPSPPAGGTGPNGGGCSAHVNALSGGYPGCNALDHYAVHANGGIGVNTDDGGLITIMSETGTVLTSDQAVQASSTGAGGTGGDIRVEAAGDIVFGTASIQAKGATTGHGGHITARSYAGAVSGALPGQLSAAGDSPPDGTVVLAACTASPATTYAGTVVPSLMSSTSCSPTQPTLPPFMQGLTDSCARQFCQFLNCEPMQPFQFSDILPPGVTNISQPGYAAGQRGAYNKDGSACPPVGYQFTNAILSTNSVDLKWDVASQPGATFQYTLTWKPEYVNALTGLPDKVTRVAWYDSTGLTKGPLVPGRACLNPKLPFPYATLAADISSGQTSISVNALAIPPALPTPPFPIMIDLERLTVTSVAGGNWTVGRGAGGTTAAAHSKFYPDGTTPKNVMSTPLPLDSSGNLMRMCIAEEGWSAYPPGTNNCPTAATPSPAVPVPAAPLACVLYSTTIFDLGDGAVSRDF